MRVREWYGWHFPELVRIVSDNHTYAKLALAIGDKKTLTDGSLHDLAALVNDDADIAQAIIDATRVSMGQDISETDMENVSAFANRVVKLAEYRKSLFQYLTDKMAVVAPNLASLIGEVVAARLISHAGSLTNLSKYPASTVQILGAEKALFRALKTKGNTPKYGLIYHSSFIGRAGAKNKGRISRFLANKCSIASRIDNFSEEPTTKFGEALKGQVEERLRFYAEGVNPTRNEEAMKAAMEETLAHLDVADPTAAGAEEEVSAPGVSADATEQKQRKEKKRKSKSGADEDVDMADIDADAASDAKAAKKAEKKRRKSEAADGEDEEKKAKKEKKEKRKSAGGEEEESGKKKKKSKKSE